MAFIYCSFNHEEEDQNVAELVKALVHQFLNALNSIPNDVLPILESMYEGRTVQTLETMTALFDVVVKHIRHPYICIDGMDELPNQVMWQLLKVLKRLDRNGRILLFGRHHIMNTIDRWWGSEEYPKLEIRAAETEVRKYLQVQIEEHEEENATIPSQFKATIVDTIATKCDRM